MLISLIIPVYNVENYLGKCLKSCICQDLPICDYEIIVVNDGSTDGSLYIAEQFAEIQDNIRIISQENKGLSGARNTGLDAACGKYVWFIDSDDWIAAECLKRIVSEMEREELDALHLGSLVAYDNKACDKERIPSFGLSKGLDVLGGLKLWHQAQLTVFRRSFLLDNKLRFYPGIYHEDMEFIPRAYYFACRCSAVSSVCYYYYQRPIGAITSEYRPKNISDAIIVAGRLKDFGESQNMDTKDAELWNNLLSVNINNLFRMAAKISSKYPEIVSYIVEASHLYRPMMKSGKIKYRLSGILISISPKMYLKLISII